MMATLLMGWTQMRTQCAIRSLILDFCGKKFGERIDFTTNEYIIIDCDTITTLTPNQQMSQEDWDWNEEDEIMENDQSI